MALEFLRSCCWALLLLPLALRADVIPFSGADALVSLQEEEQRVWSQSHDLEKAIEKGGQIYADEKLQAYVQSLMDRLYPEFGGKIRVYITKSPMLNAFALPTGHVYVNTGLIARVDNEAQLATVLAHEGAHFVNRHGFRQQQNVKGASAFAVVAQSLGVPIIGLLGQVIATSSMFGFSRDLETEADNTGFKRLVAAGFPASESYKAFEYLAKEVALSDVKEPFFYSTHPKLQDRIDNFKRLSVGMGDDAVDGKAFLEATAKLRLENLESELSFGRVKQIIALLGDDEQIKRYPSYAQYYVGEAYRRRNDKGDEALELSAYDRALTMAPSFAPTYRARGMLALKQKDYELAAKMLNHYLELDPRATDREYVENYLELAKLSSKEKQ